MGKLRVSVLAVGAAVIALAGTTVLAAPAFAGVVGTYQFGQNGQYPLGTMTFAKPNLYSDTFTQGPTDSGVWHQNGQDIKVKITTSSQPLDVGCVLKGTLTSTGIGSASAPGSIRCSDGTKGTWYAVKNAGASSMAAGTLGIHSWFQG
jgi:hypothetical protein